MAVWRVCSRPGRGCRSLARRRRGRGSSRFGPNGFGSRSALQGSVVGGSKLGVAEHEKGFVQQPRKVLVSAGPIGVRRLDQLAVTRANDLDRGVLADLESLIVVNDLFHTPPRPSPMTHST